jgi:microcystin degradation protein MlrC
MTEQMVAAADLLICFKEFPHTDFVERAEEVVDLTIRMAEERRCRDGHSQNSPERRRLHERQSQSAHSGIG